jgi:dethiobiotin synthetase
MKAGCFVTGTDTGVGKTLCAAALIHALAQRGVAVMPMKPVAAGAVMHEGAWVNEDSLALLRAAGCEASRLADVTPVLLRQPMAPHIAAAREGRTIELAPLLAAFARLREAGYVVVEGVGGFAVPLGERLDSVDLARALDLPVVLVVGVRLGCLNHAILTAGAIRAAGLELAGWIANTIDPAMAALDENVLALDERLGAPRLAHIPFSDRPQALAASRMMDVSALLEGGA